MHDRYMAATSAARENTYPSYKPEPNIEFNTQSCDFGGKHEG